MRKLFKIGAILLLFVALAAVRFLEQDIFYDPLIPFFKSNFLQTDTLPNLDIQKLLGYISLRYWVNSILSLLILWVAFNKKEIIKFSLILYAIVFFLLLIAFWILLGKYSAEDYMMLFYVRRFLIQPLLIILLLPAFYYQKRLSN